MRLIFLNDWWGGSSATDRNVHLDRLDLRDASGRVVASRELETVEPKGDCKGPNGDNFALWCNRSLDVAVEVPRAGNYRIEIVAWADQAGDELARLEVAVLDATLSGGGAVAIRDKLVELHEKLLGVEVTPYSPDIDATFALLVDVMERARRSGADYFRWWEFGLNDLHFFDGILDDIVVEKRDERGRYYEWDRDRKDAFMDSINFVDLHQTGRAWVVVLAYLLQDYRYLML